MKNLRYYINLIEAQGTNNGAGINDPFADMMNNTTRADSNSAQPATSPPAAPASPATSPPAAPASPAPPAAAPASPAPAALQQYQNRPGKQPSLDTPYDPNADYHSGVENPSTGGGNGAVPNYSQDPKPKQLAPVDPELKKLQQRLINTNPSRYNGLLGSTGADGRMGKNTREALKQYIKDNVKDINNINDPELQRILDRYKIPVTNTATPAAGPSGVIRKAAAPVVDQPTGNAQYDQAVATLRAQIAAGGPGAAGAQMALDNLLKRKPTAESRDDRTLDLIRGIQL